MIRSMSKKRTLESRIYARRRAEFLEVNPRCFNCGTKTSDVHHKFGRGPNYLNPKTWVSLCRKCHDWVRDNVAAARACGILCETGQWMVRQPE